MTAHPLRPATRQSLGRPSPHQQADRPRAHPPPKQPKPVESFQTHPCEQARTPRISHPFKRLSISEGQVTHVLLTRSPLTPPPKKKGTRPVRLACVKHAASVRPEPGSNSPKKPKNKPHTNPNNQKSHQDQHAAHPNKPRKPIQTQQSKTHPTPLSQPQHPPTTTQPEDTTTNQKKQGKPKTKNKTKMAQKTNTLSRSQTTHPQKKRSRPLRQDRFSSEALEKL